MSTVISLRSLSLCAGLGDEELEALASALGTKIYAKGVYIFHEGSPGRAMYIIHSGRVRVFAISDMGQEITIDVFGPGQFFGELSVLDGQPRSAGAVCMEPSVLRSLHADDLEHLLETCPRLARNMLRILSGRLRHTAGYAQNLAFLDVNGRVAARLLEVAGGCRAVAGGGEIELQLTQKELATWVAASRESVNKALQAFRDQGLIDMRRGTITVLDRRGLEDRVQH